MKRTLISYISDGITVALGVFIISFALSNFYLGKGFYGIIISTLLSLSFTLIYAKSAKRRRGKEILKGKDKEFYNDLREKLCFSSSVKDCNFVEEKLSSHPEILPPDSKLECIFLPDPVSANEILVRLRKLPENSLLTVVGANFTSSALELQNKTKVVKIVTLEQIVHLLKDYPLEKPKNKKKSLRSLFNITYKRKKAKIFALYGGILLVMSNFVFYPVWYIISGCLFSVYSITALFFPKSDASIV